MVRQFFHRQGQRIQRVWDSAVRVFVSGGGAVEAGATPELTPSARNALGPDDIARHLGPDTGYRHIGPE